MRGAQSPGGSGPHFRARRVYTMRRILAALAILLLLALLVPRACQTITGSHNNVGSNRGHGSAEKAAAGGSENTTAEKSAAKGGNATGTKKSGAPTTEARRAEETGGGPEGGNTADLGKI